MCNEINKNKAVCEERLLTQINGLQKKIDGQTAANYNR